MDVFEPGLNGDQGQKYDTSSYITYAFEQRKGMSMHVPFSGICFSFFVANLFRIN
jgi:hypothetical protein